MQDATFICGSVGKTLPYYGVENRVLSGNQKALDQEFRRIHQVHYIQYRYLHMQYPLADFLKTP